MLSNFYAKAVNIAVRQRREAFSVNGMTDYQQICAASKGEHTEDTVTVSKVRIETLRLKVKIGIKL